MFKSNAYKSIVNARLETTFGDHHNCRLGKWYDSGLGKDRFGHLATFKQIEEPHRLVHNEVHKNMNFIKDGDHTVEHQEEIIKNFESMEKASSVLFTLMDSLIHESENELTKKALSQ
ncbi:MAG: CZB domain-containing protein [Sulfuricurvum sp.]|nr:CZB domain-containing protein [Sulfuricurvum sp.]